MDNTSPRRVFVYRNLHTGTWSVRDLKTGLVVDHPTRLILRNPTFKVSERVRDRVRRTGRKEIHAGVVGEIVHQIDLLHDQYCECAGVSYNPYKHDRFQLLGMCVPALTYERGQVQWSCDYAILDIAATQKVTAIYVKERRCA